MDKLTYINIDELKSGDVVGYCAYPSFGWTNRFRYPIVQKKTITRITPKRTKFVLDDDITLDARDAKQLVIYNDTAVTQSEIAKRFNDIDHFQWEIEKASKNGNYIIESKITDEELIEYHNFLRKICDKYLKRIERKEDTKKQSSLFN